MQAILQAPWPSDLQRKIGEELLTSLQQDDSAAKYEAAKRLHSTISEGSFASQDAPAGRETSPLLAACFGNRSAALYELGWAEVHIIALHVSARRSCILVCIMLCRSV